jgi:hypothetical protein
MKIFGARMSEARIPSAPTGVGHSVGLPMRPPSLRKWLARAKGACHFGSGCAAGMAERRRLRCRCKEQQDGSGTAPRRSDCPGRMAPCRMQQCLVKSCWKYQRPGERSSRSPMVSPGAVPGVIPAGWPCLRGVTYGSTQRAGSLQGDLRTLRWLVQVVVSMQSLGHIRGQGAEWTAGVRM